MITSEEIKRRLWNGANDLRGSMDASRYKDYMLGLLFYKFLSDKTLETFRKVSGMKDANEEQTVIEYTKAIETNGTSVTSMLQKVLGYYVQPKYLYQSWLKDIDEGHFEVQKVTDGLNDFERTIDDSNDSDDFKGLFSNSTLDLSDTALGSDLKTRSNNIKQLIQLFADLNMADLQKGDVLGDAYEYLIGMFAMESGKKAGEFYTPRQVSEVMAQIVAKSGKIESIYDAAVGSGSLLLTVSKHLDKEAQKNLNYYGQEKNTATFNLTRMNLLLHGVRPDRMTIRNADTLGQDWPEDPSRPNEGVQFDAVVMNPPYSLSKWNKEGIKASDPRFEFVGVLPPDSKGDYAFLLHGLYHLGQQGTMAIVLPHGVLFRGGTEGEIRKRLIEKNYLDAIIGLPSNLFTNTGIPVTVIILKKNRELKKPVLIIDASHGFIKSGKTNKLQEKDIAKIVDTYVNKTEEEGYSHLATLQEISGNDYNLNIPRYVDSNNNDIPQDVDGHLLGGIPEQNIKAQQILQELVPDILKSSFNEIRPGYVKMIISNEELSKQVMASEKVNEIISEINKEIDTYISKYWDILTNPKDSLVTDIKEKMLLDIEDICDKYDFIDKYDAYQIITDLWDTSLMHDMEVIEQNGFIQAGNMREENMVTKGSGDKKRQEQIGWNGVIVPNDLVSSVLYKEDNQKIENLKDKLGENDNSLSELLDLVKEDGTKENDALSGIYDAEKEALDSTKIKEELKKTDKGSEEYKYLKNAEKLFSENKSINKEIKNSEQTLSKEVEDRILVLTKDEINKIMFMKWFGGLKESCIQLVKKPIQNELDIIKMVSERYEETLDDIERQEQELEKQIEEMMKELV